MFKKFLDKLCSVFSGEYECSHRFDNGVKVDIIEHWGCITISVDLDDDQTKEHLKKSLEEYAKYDVVDGKLIRNDK